ncbi:hypothetical protein WMY93_022218 [Mugilogobius chulae]|uniref:Uncharacterized protein n=1 Tax=Mugilogobius chulae TaxID=88201 RepID=A0AAW0NIS0_9GOBI
MKTLLALALLLFVATQVEGQRKREGRKLKIYDLVRGTGGATEAPPSMVPKPQKPSSDFKGFDLEDALNPANNGKKSTEPAASDAATLSEIKRKLDALMEIENLQMRMLQRMNRCA